MNLSPNVGTTDRAIRLAVALILVVLAATGVVGGLLATLAVVVALVMVATALLGFCPLYPLVGMNTCPLKK
ncbi:MAG: DUF2892 domain-containing protein [Alphaproteobacteria bacterium]